MIEDFIFKRFHENHWLKSRILGRVQPIDGSTISNDIEFILVKLMKE